MFTISVFVFCDCNTSFLKKTWKQHGVLGLFKNLCRRKNSSIKVLTFNFLFIVAMIWLFSFFFRSEVLNRDINETYDAFFKGIFCRVLLELFYFPLTFHVGANASSIFFKNFDNVPLKVKGWMCVSFLISDRVNVRNIFVFSSESIFIHKGILMC